MPELNPKGSGAAVEEAAREGAAASAVGEAASEKVELPAFLPSAEFMPPDYEELTSGQEASFDLTKDDVVFYAGRIGVRLSRDQEGNTYLNFPGKEFPRRCETVVVESPGTSTSEWKGERGSGEFPQEGILLKPGWEIIMSYSSVGLNFSSVWYREFNDVRPPRKEIDIVLSRDKESTRKFLFLKSELNEDGQLMLISPPLSWLDDDEREKIIVPAEALTISGGAGVSSGEAGAEQVGVRAGMGTGVALTEEPKVGERLAVVDREGRAGAEKAGLPAFLEEGELPKGYERIVREDGGSHRFVTAEFLPDGTVFYIGRHSVKLEELDGKTFLSFPGISLEKQVGWRTGGDPPPRSVLSKDKIELLSRDHRLKIHGNCPTSISSDKIVLFKGFSYGSGDFKDKILPCVDEVLFPGHVRGENGQEIDFTDLGSGLFDGTKIKVRVDEIGAGYRETGKKIFQLDIDYFPVGGVAVRNKIIAIPIEQPSTAVVARPAGAGVSLGEMREERAGARAGMGTGVASTEEPEAGERLAVVDREGRAGAAKAELPAFLEEGELPEGYESIGLAPEQSQLVHLDLVPGSTLVCYAENVGVRLTRGKNGVVFFRFEGIPLPSSILASEKEKSDHAVNLSPVPATGIPLIEDGRIHTVVLSSPYSKKDADQAGFVGGYNSVHIFFPKLIAHSGRKIFIPNFGYYTGLSFWPRGDNVKIANSNAGEGGELKIAVPSAAMVRGGEVEAVEERAGLVPGAGVEQVAAEWKEGLKGKGNELAKSLEDYINEASLSNLVNLLERFTNLGVGVYLERPEVVGEEEFGQQAVGFDGAAKVMMGYFRQILGDSESLVFNPIPTRYGGPALWSEHLKQFFDQAVAFDELISESAKEGQRDYAILGAAALTRVGQLVFSRIPEGEKVDIGELRKLYQEAVERYLSRLTSISK